MPGILYTIYFELRMLFALLVITPLHCIYWLFNALLPDFLLPAADLRGKRVLITGAGSGLGALLSIKLASHGCNLVLWDIDKAGLERTENSLRAKGVAVSSYVLNLTDRKQIYETATKVDRDVGPIDILVNNAGVASGKPILESDDISIERTFQVNVISNFWTVKSFLPSMLARRTGHIVTIASTAGFFGVPHFTAYCASKSAVVAFHESLRAELAFSDDNSAGPAPTHERSARSKRESSNPRRTSANAAKRIQMTLVCPHFIKGTNMLLVGDRDQVPLLMPYLRVEYVVDRIVTAIRRREPYVIMPRFIYICNYLKYCLPGNAVLLLQRYTNIANWYAGAAHPSNMERVFKD